MCSISPASTRNSLEINGASTGTVTFAGGTGELKLDAPASFTGHIDGFTGTAPDAAHSDEIDLASIDYNAKGFSEQYSSTTGVLKVTDGTNSAQFTFDNFGGRLKFASDGNGGTMIFDPPKTQAPATPGASATGDSFNFQPAKGSDASGHFDWVNEKSGPEPEAPRPAVAPDDPGADAWHHLHVDVVHSTANWQQVQAQLQGAVHLN